MSVDVKNFAQDVQDRIRDLACLMWESAGKQQNMALQYWLRAEQEILSSMQAATEILLPAKGQREEATHNPALPATPSSVDPIEAPQTEAGAARITPKAPAEPKSRQPTARRNAALAEAAASADSETSARRPTPVKAGGRRKMTK
jgi:hypothetical protein